MQEVSQEWITANEQDILPRSNFDLVLSNEVITPTNITFTGTIYGESDIFPECSPISVLTHKYDKDFITCEQNEFEFTSEQEIYTNNYQNKFGYWSNSITNENGVFIKDDRTRTLLVEYKFDEISAKGLYIKFDKYAFPNVFILELLHINGSAEQPIFTKSYNGETPNTSDILDFSDISYSNVNAIRIYVEKMSLPYCRFKLKYITFGIVKGYKSDDLISATIKQNCDLLSLSLPTNELSFEIDNTENQYNPYNPKGIYSSIKRGTPISADITLDLDTPETISGGKYYIYEWDTPQNGISATFTARELTAFMDSNFDYSTLTKNTSSKYQECEYIQSKQGALNYIELNHTYTLNTHIECDFQFADVEDENDFRNYVFFPSDSDFTKKYFSLFQGKKNANENGLYFGISYGTGNEPTYIKLDDMRYDRIHFEMVGNRNAISIKLNGITKAQNIDLTSLETTDNKITLLSNCSSDAVKLYSCKITELLGTSNYLLPIYKKSNNKVGVVDIWNNNTITMENSSGLGHGEDCTSVSMYNLVNKAILNSSVSSLASQFSYSTIPQTMIKYMYSYSYTCAEVLQLVANACCMVMRYDRNGVLHIESLNNTMQNYIITQQIETTYPEYEITEELGYVNVNNGQCIIGNQSGAEQTIDNTLIQSYENALAVAQWVQSVLSKNTILSGEFRPDTRLDYYDKIKINTKFGDNSAIVVNELEYSYSGSFLGTYKGRKF